MDIVERLQAAMHGESAIHAPRTTEAIEAMRAAQGEIERLRAEIERHATEPDSEWMDGYNTGYEVAVRDLRGPEAKCPLVKSMEWENGVLKRIEFFAPIDYPSNRE